MCLNTKNNLLKDMNRGIKQGKDISKLVIEMAKVDQMLKDIAKNHKFEGVESLEIYINKLTKIYNERHPRYGDSIIVTDQKNSVYFSVEEAEYLVEQLQVLIEKVKKNEEE